MAQETEKISVRSIAQHLGLSPATVSLALNGRRPTSFVSPETCRQVWAAAKELGYPLDRLRSQRPLLNRVAVFLPTGPNPVFSESALMLCRDLGLRRVQVIVNLSRTHREAGIAAQDLYRRQEIDAAVFIGSRDEIVPGEVPSVFIGEVPDNASVWQVRADNEGGGRSVAEYLWAHGHRSIAAVMPASANLVGARRMAGLTTYWEEQGAQISADRVLRIDVVTASEADLRELIVEFLTKDQATSSPATAMFCYNDWVAGKVLKVLRSHGISVPEQMSVVGFDDSIYAELFDPPLTTVHTSFDTLGSLAAELVLEQAEDLNATPRVVVAPCRLIGRQSCGVPRRK